MGAGAACGAADAAAPQRVRGSGKRSAQRRERWETCSARNSFPARSLMATVIRVYSSCRSQPSRWISDVPAASDPCCLARLEGRLASVAERMLGATLTPRRSLFHMANRGDMIRSDTASASAVPVVAMSGRHWSGNERDSLSLMPSRYLSVVDAMSASRLRSLSKASCSI